MLAIFGLSCAIMGSTWLSRGAISVDLEDFPRVLGVLAGFWGMSHVVWGILWAEK
jgi:hypothetical protein